MESPNILANFYKNVKTYDNKPFLRQPFGDRWEVTSWKETSDKARRIATGLQSLGLEPRAHIGLVSKNCREWVIADLAIMIAGYVSVPLYPTLTGPQMAEVLDIGDVKAIFVGKLEVWDDMKTGIPAEMPVIKFPHYEGNSKIDRGEDLNEFMAKHEPLVGDPIPDPKDIWTIVFTSGTTGTPKGVVLTYENLNSTRGIIENGDNHTEISLTGDNRFFSFLPLNHIAERVVVETGAISYGGEISFSESLAQFAKNLSESKPTVFFAVPRIWTKLQQGILSKMPQKKLDFLLKIPIVSGIVKKKIVTGLGFDQCRSFISGAAPISANLKAWFKKVGIPIDEGYGMTENCAICTFLPADQDRKGSVGPAQYGVEMKIDEENDEILMRAPFVMTEYYNNPEKTAEALDNGWLRTGDQGKIDADGHLHITGRVKDTFKTAKGQFIIPAPMEWTYFGSNNDIDQICIVGRGMPQPLALIVPSDTGMAKSKQELRDSLMKDLNYANEKLPGYKKISTVVIVKDAWQVENGCLTPTLKVKRPALNTKYQDLLEGWHEDQEAVVFE